MPEIIAVPSPSNVDVWVVENSQIEVLGLEPDPPVEIIVVGQSQVIRLIDTGKGDPGPMGPAGESVIVFEMPYNLYVTQSVRTYRFPFAGTILGVSGSLSQAPVGSPVIIDVNLNGTTVFTDQNDRPQFADGIDDLPELPLNVPFVEGDRCSTDVDDIGSTFEGEDLAVYIRFERAAQ
jgi:hypothetical protein